MHLTTLDKAEFYEKRIREVEAEIKKGCKTLDFTLKTDKMSAKLYRELHKKGVKYYHPPEFIAWVDHAGYVQWNADFAEYPEVREMYEKEYGAIKHGCGFMLIAPINHRNINAAIASGGWI